MSEAFAVFILMSNYFHDVATAMLIASSVLLLIAHRTCIKHRGSDPDAETLFIRLYRSMAIVMVFSWLWLLAAGALRIWTFRSFEWPHFAGKGYEAGLIVKYCIAATMVVSGSFLWTLMKRKIRTG